MDTLCYAVADSGDRLVTIDRITGGSFTDVGGLGVPDVEAVEWNINATVLYGTNNGTLGTINTSTGAFTAIGSAGSGTGTETPSGDGNVTFNDLDGLAMDATTGIMYASQRNGDQSAPDDVLIQLNLSTGAHVNDAFGAGQDFVSIKTSALGGSPTLYDVDDIAVDPTDGQMYGVVNSGGNFDRLVKINKATGVVTDVGRLRKANNSPINDMEGFSFYNDGTFYGTTGQNGNDGNGNRLWQIDTATGIATEIGQFASYGDYEAVACLTGGSNTITGTAFHDVNANGAWNSGGPDTAYNGATVRLYRDADNNGSYETLVNTKTTGPNGFYSFEVALKGDFKVEIDTGTLPAPNLTTPSNYEISFPDFGNTDANNDFGYVTSGSIGNYVWLDLNSDGVQDANEPGLPGITVELRDSGNNVIDTTTTDANGLYSFPDIDAGTYSVNVASNMGTLGLGQTYDPDEAGVCVTCDAKDENINLAQGQVYNLADFGYVGTASIGDFVWDDTNSNGSYDVGEAGLSGVTVELTWYGPDGVAGGNDDVTFTTVTDGGGYDFTGLPAGTYSVDIDTTTAPAGYVLTTNNDPLPVTLSSGQDYNDADFGLYRAPEAIKQLYFSETGQGLDRIDPVATNDTTTATSAPLSVPATNYQVRDEFNNGKVYSGNDGINNWAGNWVEVGDDNDADGGDIKVKEKLDKLGFCEDGDFCVEFKTAKSSDKPRYIYRQVDMSSAVGATSATFSFDYYYKLDDSNAEVKAQYSCDGGSNWTTFAGGAFNQSGGEQANSFSAPIPCTTANTRVRFDSSGTKEGKTFAFDNVDISWVLSPTPDTETFTQGAALVGNLDLPAGGEITVQAYLDVTTGFIDLSQPVPMEAKVRYGANTLVTLNNPVVTALLPPILNDVEDTFPVKKEYDGNTGSVNWTGDWQEENDDNDPDGGDIKVDDAGDCPTGNCLEIKAKELGAAVLRQANLAGAVSAVLTYDYSNQLERKNGSENDVVVVEVSKNGVSYTPLFSHTGDDNGEADSKTFDITAFAGPNTTIRFRVAEEGEGKELYIDNVNITYGVNDTLYLATWSGTTPANTTMNSGSAIAVDITSAVGGTTMNVLYDSTTRPSQLNMKVSSFINVDSLAIYDAAYPGGNVVTESEPGDTVYFRVVVSDPFGAADITDVDLGITDIGCGPVSTTLTDGAKVADTSATKTYEYAWNVGACEGGYLATVTANEGTEGVTARKATPFDVKSPEDKLGAIGNYVWLDENGDGVQDAGEAGIANLTVTLSGTDIDGNPVSRTTTTDANGGYLFPDLPESNGSGYTVTVTPKAGLNPTYNEDTGTTGPDSITTVVLAAGEEHLTADFGYNWVPPTDSSNPTGGATGAIGDRVWNDADGDGVQDPGESGIGGVTVKLLTDSNGDGIYGGPGDNAPTTTVTAADGSYIFDNLPAGGYVVEVDGTTLPAGLTQTGDPDGVIDNKTTTPIVLAPGDVFVNADFGYQPSAGSTIGDTIFVDPNGNGTQDAGEPGIPGVTVALKDGSGNIIATTVTDEDGKYSFPGLPAGAYTVVVTDTDNVLGELSPISDSDGGNDNQSTTTVDGTTNDLDQDFGYLPEGHTPGDGLIGDRIFLDADGSNSDSAGDPGLEGVTVELYDAAGTTLLASTTTDENGNYFFGGLNPNATYTVKVDPATLPNGGAGMTNSVDPDGGNNSQSVVALNNSGANDGVNDPDGAGNGINLGQDFGYKATTPNTIQGTVWEDSDANGTLDESGAGIPGVTVDLYLDSNNNGVIDDGDTLINSAVTDGNGDYSFPGLPDGNYLVDVTDEDNVLDGYWHSDGPNDGLDNNSQTDPYPVSVTGGQTNNTGDFGYYVEPAALGSFVWNDADKNGIQNTGEAGIDGVVVELTITYPNNGHVTVLKTVTGDDPSTPSVVEKGWYSFGNLLLDENFNGDGNGAEPTFEISVDPLQTALSTYLVTPKLNEGGDDMIDADDPSGVAATPVQGRNDVTQNAASPGAESNPNAGYDFGFYTNPLSVALGYAFAERVDDGTVYFLWETATETGNAGFNLYMAVGDEASTLVTQALIPSRVVDSVTPVRYTYQAEVAGDSYFIEMVNVSGGSERYGPYNLGVEYGEPKVVDPTELVNPLYLPLISGR